MSNNVIYTEYMMYFEFGVVGFQRSANFLLPYAGWGGGGGKNPFRTFYAFTRRGEGSENFQFC